MKCPRCQTPLVRGRLAEHSILEKVHNCETCKGTFIGPDDLADVEIQHDDVFFEFRHVPSDADQLASLTCPACEVPMNKATSERDAHVVMDVCPKCKCTWLDGGEIEALKTESLLSNLRSLFRATP
jgi:Zn-finger nucleic acid-binding protein